jgi:sRNA-binding carbon storage regulator CsrA
MRTDFMLVQSREIGQAIVIEDVLVTLITVAPHYAEVALQKLSGGKSLVVTLPHNESVDACYDTKLVYIQSFGQKARLGIDVPPGIRVHRKEVWDVIQ